MKRLAASSVILLALASATAQAQWLKVPKGHIPRLADGKPNLSAPAPRTADGTPDLSGIWNVDIKYVFNLDADLKPDSVPFQPWAKALFDERKGGAHSWEDNAAHCLPPYGGFNGNCGVQDAHNIAWKLALVLKGEAGPALLDT